MVRSPLRSAGTRLIHAPSPVVLPMYHRDRKVIVRVAWRHTQLRKVKIGRPAVRAKKIARAVELNFSHPAACAPARPRWLFAGPLSNDAALVAAPARGLVEGKSEAARSERASSSAAIRRTASAQSRRLRHGEGRSRQRRSLARRRLTWSARAQVCSTEDGAGERGMHATTRRTDRFGSRASNIIIVKLYELNGTRDAASTKARWDTTARKRLARFEQRR